MTAVDDVVALLGRHAEGLTDAQIAAELGIVHQRANQVGRKLVADGRAVRDSSSGVIVTRLCVPIAPLKEEAAPTAAHGTPEVRGLRMRHDDRDWFWEGNVQASVITYLEGLGWRILHAADTESRERGFDVVAAKDDGARLVVEVKGWPSTTYSRGERAGQQKPTSPTLQASHWLASGLFAALRSPSKEPHARLGLALPDMPRYRSLLAEIGWALLRLEVVVFLVDEDGDVCIAHQSIAI